RTEDHSEHGVGGAPRPWGTSGSVFTVVLRSSSVRKKMIRRGTIGRLFAHSGAHRSTLQIERLILHFMNSVTYFGVAPLASSWLLMLGCAGMRLRALPICIILLVQP